MFDRYPDAITIKLLPLLQWIYFISLAVSHLGIQRPHMISELWKMESLFPPLEGSMISAKLFNQVLSL